MRENYLHKKNTSSNFSNINNIIEIKCPYSECKFNTQKRDNLYIHLEYYCNYFVKNKETSNNNYTNHNNIIIKEILQNIDNKNNLNNNDSNNRTKQKNNSNNLVIKPKISNKNSNINKLIYNQNIQNYIINNPMNWNKDKFKN